MSYLLKLGDYTFANTWHIAADGREMIVGSAKLARNHGGRLLPGTLGPKRFMVRGGLFRELRSDSHTALRTALDSLYSELLADGPQTLYYGEDDRYYRCVQVERVNPTFTPTSFLRFAEIEVEMIGPDPFRYSTTQTSDTWSAPSSGGTRSITAGGNAPALPKFTITVGGSGSQSVAFTLANNTTGESFTLQGTVSAGDVIVVDSLLKTVKIGSTNEIDLFDGQFPKLNVGANTLQVTISTSSITSIVTTFNARYW